MTYAVNIHHIKAALAQVYESEAWARAVTFFTNSRRILYIGHGGNLAIADHAAIDCTRITGGVKVGYAPGSAILSTSLINDNGWDKWLAAWVAMQLIIGNEPACLIVLTSTGSAPDIAAAIEKALNLDVVVICFTANPIFQFHQDANYCEIGLGVTTYHDCEMLSLGLTYDLLVAAGFKCPPLK